MIRLLSSHVHTPGFNETIAVTLFVFFVILPIAAILYYCFLTIGERAVAKLSDR